MNWLLLNRIFFVLILISPAFKIQGQVVINELSSRNSKVLKDFYKDHPDWIELLNTGIEPVNLKDYLLSDDLTKPDKWSFPEVILPPDSHLIVFASNKNSKVVVDHWETAIHAWETWKFWIPDSEPDPAWKDLGFSDSGWSEGPGGFGRGDGDDNTILPDTVATVYLRKTFIVPDTSTISLVLLHVDYDDAFVAYLNGVEIARTNIGWPGRIQRWDDFSYDVHKAVMYQGLPPEEFPIDISLFRTIVKNGENVLAIQALNAWNNHGNFSIIPFLSFGMKDSSFTFQQLPAWFGEKPIHLHTNFALSGQGESLILSDPNLNPIEQVNYPYIKSDQSYGKKPDGSGTWKYFSQPTPGLNNELSNAYLGYTKEPHFSMEAGFYSNAAEVSFLNYQAGDTIRFTTDGSWVTDTSEIYSGESIVIDSTIVLRAQFYKAGYLPGKVSSNSYIIGYTSTLPVISISLNPRDLWDWEEGIYVLGPNASPIYPYLGANYWMDWQKPSHIEYFDEQQDLGFELDADIMIHGGYSRVFPMKSLRVIADSKYDEPAINYQLFKDKDIHSFNKFVLRNSGQDFNVTHFRDALMQKSVQSDTNVDIQDYEPVVVLLNGHYWGIHNMREKIDRFYVNSNHGVVSDSMHVLRDNIKIVEGNYYQYMQMIEYVKSLQSVDSLACDSIGKLLDIHNYTDYFIAEMYYVNPDWPLHNTKYWRSFADGAKWRYIMTDLDFGLGLYSQVYQNELVRVLYSSIPWSDNHWALRKLMLNADYRKYFINRSADMFNTLLLPQNIVENIASFKSRLAPEMMYHIPRWGGTFTAWESHVQLMTNFVLNRLPYVWQHYIDEFELEKLITISLNVDSTKHGKIRINSIVPDSLPWQGVYFDGNPVEISVIPDSGYIFSHWSSNMIINGPDTLNPKLIVNVDTGDVFTAHFTKDPFIQILPKMVFSEINYSSSDTLDAGDWVEVWNIDTTFADLSGWIFKDNDDAHEFVFPLQTILNKGQYLILCRDTSEFQSVYPDSLSYIGPFVFGLSGSGDQLRLFDFTGTLVLAMEYSHLPPWPSDVVGTGKTLELSDPLGNLNDGSNWFSGCIGGSPGGPFTLCDTLIVNEKVIDKHLINLYPNPAEGTLSIEFIVPDNEDVIIEIFNSIGNLVLRLNFSALVNTTNLLEIDVSRMFPGVYFVMINGKKLNYVNKILIK